MKMKMNVNIGLAAKYVQSTTYSWHRGLGTAGVLYKGNLKNSQFRHKGNVETTI